MWLINSADFIGSAFSLHRLYGEREGRTWMVFGAPQIMQFFGNNLWCYAVVDDFGNLVRVE